MKKSVLLSTLVLASGLFAVSGLHAEESGVMSLRAQSLDVQDPPEKMKNFPKENLGLPLSYVQQPPLIPHHIRDYKSGKEKQQVPDMPQF